MISPQRRSQQVGQSLEDKINFANQLYFNRGEAWIAHNGIKGIWRSRGRGKPLFHPLPKADQPVDYHGFVDGKAFAFDAKSTDNKTKWTLKRDRIHEYQHLLEVAHFGGALAFFAIEFRRRDVLYLVRMRPDHAIEDGWWIPGTQPPPISFRPDKHEASADLITVPMLDGWYNYLPPVKSKWLE